MEILEPAENNPWQFRCVGCRALLKADYEDIHFGYFGVSWGGETPEPYFYVECPVCGTYEKQLEDIARLPEGIKTRIKCKK